MNEDVITEVDQPLPLLQGLLTHGGQRHHRLNLGAIAGSQCGKAEFAGIALKDDPASDGDDVARCDVRFQALMGRADRADGVGHGQPDRVGITPDLKQAITLLTAHAHLLRGIVADVIGEVVAHAAGCRTAISHNRQG